MSGWIDEWMEFRWCWQRVRVSYLDVIGFGPPKYYLSIDHHDGDKWLAWLARDKDLLHEHRLEVDVLEESSKHQMIAARP